MALTTLDYYRGLYELNRLNRQRVVDRNPLALPTSEQQIGALNVTVSSVEYPVFVLGVHDPDDSGVSRYIP